MSLNSIRTVVQAELAETDHFLISTLNSEIPFINELVAYILECGGKRIRPLLVLLAAKAANHTHDKHIQLAGAIELVHTATLLHDDVVDKSDLRRSNKTANALWGNEASVLVGDFLYSRAFQIIVGIDNTTIIKTFANATNLIAEGEVLQLLNCKNPDTTLADYYNVIERKTAKLFEVAALTGALLGNLENTQQQGIQAYGLHLGISYQLIDDALDYSQSLKLGKTMCKDLQEGKPTLPLLHALTHGSKSECRLIRKAISQGETQHMEDILSIIESKGSITYTANAAKNEMQKALRGLQTIPNSPYKQALTDLADFVVARSH